MICKYCGYNNPRGAKFCGKCGAQLSNNKPNTQKYIPIVVCSLVIVAVLVAVFLKSSDSDLPSISRPSVSTVKVPKQETHTHSWKSATCTTPKTCTTCGHMEGSVGGHRWVPATYTSPKTCSVCGTTSGNALNPLSKYNVGDGFAFGVYEQDGSSGNGIERIGWRVLAKETNKILVISELGLESRRYHRQNTSVDWDGCSLRSWLNGNFYDAAFSAEEKSQILATTVEGSSSQDNLFLLSYDEVENYFSGNNDRVCYATRFALNQGAYASPHNGGSWWLLRTPGKNSRYVMSINTDGSIDYDGGRVSSDYGVVRPAMWLDISS